MDCTIFTISFIMTVLSFFQNSLALSPRHLEAKKLLRLLDNSVTAINNHSRLLSVDESNHEVRTTREKQTRLYVEVLDAGMPLTIIVEPQCGILTKWTIHLVEYNSDETKKVIDVVHPQTKRKSYVKIIDTMEKGIMTELAEYRSKEFSEFKLRGAPAGLYVITLSSEENGRAMVSSFQEREIFLQYPIMPTDRKVSFAKTSKTSYSFFWEKAIMENEGKNSAGKMRYCVLVHKKGLVPNFCAAQQLMRTKHGSLYHSECFHGRSEFTLTKVSSSTPFLFVSVFAIHPESNKSLAYDGVKILASDVTRETTIQEGTVVTGKIWRNKGYEVVTYNKSMQTNVRFSLVSCDTTLTFCIAHNKKVIRCHDVPQAVDTYILKDAKPGQYLITLTSSRKKNGQFRLFVSSLGARQPFPNLPSGRVIKQWPLLRKCQSVTLAWIGVHGRQQYCLYVRPVINNASYRKQGLCWRAQDIKENERVYCTYKRLRRREKTVFTKTITNLQPCTKYEFVVQVKKIRASESLMYKPVRVVTKCRKC